jgi:hypothetical protein
MGRLCCCEKHMQVMVFWCIGAWQQLYVQQGRSWLSPVLQLPAFAVLPAAAYLSIRLLLRATACTARFLAVRFWGQLLPALHPEVQANLRTVGQAVLGMLLAMSWARASSGITHIAAAGPSSPPHHRVLSFTAEGFGLGLVLSADTTDNDTPGSHSSGVGSNGDALLIYSGFTGLGILVAVAVVSSLHSAAGMVQAWYNPRTAWYQAQLSWLAEFRDAVTASRECTLKAICVALNNCTSELFGNEILVKLLVLEQAEGGDQVRCVE